MRHLAAAHAAFAKPVAQHGAPAADLYQLTAPVSALGYRSSQVVLTPARILLATQVEPLPQVAARLGLQSAPYAPAARVVRPTVSVVAFRLAHKGLENSVLVGCEYATPAAARWVR